MFSWMEVLGQWKHGILYPRWAALAQWGYGEARFLFYPPASWTLGAALGAVLPWKMVPGAYCWIVLTLAGAAMYRLAREWLAVPDALFAAVFYALNPYHLLIVYWRSAYAELLGAALLPLLPLCLLRLNQPLIGRSPGDQHSFRPSLWLSLLLAAAWLTDVPAAVMIHYSTAGLAVVLAACELTYKRSRSQEVWRPLVQTALAIVLGAGLVSFYLLPAIYEQGWISVSRVMAPGVRPQDNFLFTTIADPDHNRFNSLVSILALAEIGALAFAMWFARRWRAPRPQADSKSWMLLSVWGTASALLMLSWSNLLWQYLPRLRFVQLPFRWLLCLNAALAVLLAMAAKRWTSRLLASAVFLAVVVIAGYRTQTPWWASAGDINEMSDAIDDGPGYDGVYEYVPAGADPSELNKDLPLVADETGAPISAEMLAWGETEKHFVVHAAKPQNLQLRLFNYPAWEVAVNDRPAPAQTAEVTGQMVIPILAGTNDVRIHFQPTIDRTAGDAISWASLMLLAAVWIKTRRQGASGSFHQEHRRH